MNGRWALRAIISFVVLVAGLPVFAQEKTPLDTNLDKVWGNERELKIIEKKQFQTDRRHEIGVYLGVIPNDPFFVYMPVGIRYDYHFMEGLSFEVAGAYIPSFENTLRSDLEVFSGGNIDRVEVPERVQWYGGVNILWTPFHGKFSVMNKKITSFDAGFLVGLGMMGSQVYNGTAKKWETRWSYDGAIPFNLMANLGAFLKFYATDYLAVGIDYRHYIFPGYPGKGNGEWSDGVRSLAEITIGVTYFTPAPK